MIPLLCRMADDELITTWLIQMAEYNGLSFESFTKLYLHWGPQRHFKVSTEP